MSNHALKDVNDITGAFKKAGVDISKPMIFIGGAGATVVKAAADHVGFPGPKKVFDVNIKDWIAKNPKTELVT
jgi:3-mercaptopyruvate sulfurtransferase SseA